MSKPNKYPVTKKSVPPKIVFYQQKCPSSNLSHAQTYFGALSLPKFIFYQNNVLPNIYQPYFHDNDITFIGPVVYDSL